MNLENMSFESIGMHTYLSQNPESTYEQLLNASSDDAASVASILQELRGLGLLIQNVNSVTGEPTYSVTTLKEVL